MNGIHLWSGCLEEISWWVPKWWHACFYLHVENWQIIERNQRMQFLKGSQLKSQRNLAYKGILVSKVCLQNVLETYNFLVTITWTHCLLGTMKTLAWLSSWCNNALLYSERLTHSFLWLQLLQNCRDLTQEIIRNYNPSWCLLGYP